MIYLTAHTINCVCHSIRSMFIVLGIYNFAPPHYTNSQNSILSFGHGDFQPKNFLILYPSFENSTTSIAINAYYICVLKTTTMHAGLSKEQHWNTFTKSLPLSPPPIRCVKVYHSSKQPAKSIVTMYLDFVFLKLSSISGFFRLHHFLLHQQRRKYKSLAHSTSYYIGGYITFRYVFLGVGNSQEKVLVP